MPALQNFPHCPHRVQRIAPARAGICDQGHVDGVGHRAREPHLLTHGQQRLGNRERGAGDVAADEADLEAAVLHQQPAERVVDCRHMQEFASLDELPQAFGLHTSSRLFEEPTRSASIV
jgi:hypothetical protein